MNGALTEYIVYSENIALCIFMICYTEGINKMLLQDRLDVIQKTRANIFNWRGQFTPQLIDHIISTYSANGDVVVDPFSGSGTVLAECVNKGIKAYGLEINPAAYAMSKFYSLSNLNKDEKIAIFGLLESKINHCADKYHSLPVWYDDQDYRKQYGNLMNFIRDIFPSLQRGFEKTLILNMLFICENHKKMSLPDSLCTSFEYIRSVAMTLPFSFQPVNAKLLDARSFSVNENIRANMIVTSPPYINVFNYHQNHRAVLEASGWDMLRVASSEFGSNRKNRANRFRTVVQYCLDMEQAICSFWSGLQVDGLLIMIVGRESNVRGVPFYNGQLIKEISIGIQVFKMIEERERTFLNKFGQIIKEDVFVFQKTPKSGSRQVGRLTAMKHLERSLESTLDQDISGDIKNALRDISSVDSSPVFSAKEAHLYD